ncbi:hypothetical protein BFJ63_vAg18354 [Fusarium oxysporum f. sp. narcissi]|uniref:Uncharacterized protein n=1 Tax=Fusarium oxysporum f. sp. narcissi TaxID=451672 RepID=A0A4Q2UXL0_FUSOX|nr:hypothetical protein BFJ63_vAg18354 [Fusarium oxysporum f. sp. narcissi]
MAYVQHHYFYFAESDEADHRITAQEAARVMARQQQDTIRIELSKIAGDEYLEDVMQHMRQMEVYCHLAQPINKHTRNIYNTPQIGHSAMEFYCYGCNSIW